MISKTNLPLLDSFGLRFGEIDMITNIFDKNQKINKAYLYGSRAKGNFKKGSDIDICIEGEGLTLSDQFEINNAYYDLPIPQFLDISLKNYINNPALLEHIKRVGKLIYQK